MSKTYTPGSEADAIVERQLAKGGYSSADEVVRAGIQPLDLASWSSPASQPDQTTTAQ